MPTAHEALQASAREGHDAGALQAALARLVNQSLRHSAVPDDGVAASLRGGIGALRGRLAAAPPPLREPVANLLAHLDTLLRLRSKQGGLLRAISQVPVSARIDALTAVFTRQFDAELARQFGYQRLLLAYSAVALLLVIGGAGFIGYRNATERRRLSALADEKTRELKELATRDDLTRVHNRRHMGELLGRWGGEEFLLALPQTSLDQAELVLRRIREALAGADFSDLGSAVQVAFSGGLVLLGRDEPIAVAVERADQAMYRAKTAGRNRTERG